MDKKDTLKIEIFDLECEFRTLDLRAIEIKKLIGKKFEELMKLDKSEEWKEPKK